MQSSWAPVELFEVERLVNEADSALTHEARGLLLVVATHQVQQLEKRLPMQEDRERAGISEVHVVAVERLIFSPVVTCAARATEPGEGLQDGSAIAA